MAAPGSELADRWEQEPEWDGRVLMRPGRAVDECPECGSVLSWEPGRTVTFCGECPRVSLPAAVAEHYQRQAEPRAEVATRAAPDSAASRAARVKLRALAQRMADRVREWIDAFDPEDLSGGTERAALDYRAELAAWLPEIKNADTEAELAAIMAEVNAITERARTSGVLDAIERQREAVEREAEMAERRAELAEQEAEEARAAELAERERQRRAAIEARAQRQAVRPPAPRGQLATLPNNGYLAGAVTLAGLVEASRKAKEQQIEKFGQCEYQHRKPVAAERRYYISTVDWSGNTTGYEVPQAPSVLVCRKHFTTADNWIQEQAALVASAWSGKVAAVYWELK